MIRSWIAREEIGYRTGWTVRPEGDYAIATVHPRWDAKGQAYYDAKYHARLIAAAPDLLAACQAVIDTSLDGFEYAEASPSMKAAYDACVAAMMKVFEDG